MAGTGASGNVKNITRVQENMDQEAKEILYERAKKIQGWKKDEKDEKNSVRMIVDEEKKRIDALTPEQRRTEVLRTETYDEAYGQMVNDLISIVKDFPEEKQEGVLISIGDALDTYRNQEFFTVETTPEFRKSLYETIAGIDGLLSEYKAKRNRKIALTAGVGIAAALVALYFGYNALTSGSHEKPGAQAKTEQKPEEPTTQPKNDYKAVIPSPAPQKKATVVKDDEEITTKKTDVDTIENRADQVAKKLGEREPYVAHKETSKTEVPAAVAQPKKVESLETKVDEQRVETTKVPAPVETPVKPTVKETKSEPAPTFVEPKAEPKKVEDTPNKKALDLVKEKYEGLGLKALYGARKALDNIAEKDKALAPEAKAFAPKLEQKIKELEEKSKPAETVDLGEKKQTSQSTLSAQSFEGAVENYKVIVLKKAPASTRGIKEESYKESLDKAEKELTDPKGRYFEKAKKNTSYPDAELSERLGSAMPNQRKAIQEKGGYVASASYDAKFDQVREYITSRGSNSIVMSVKSKDGQDLCTKLGIKLAEDDAIVKIEGIDLKALTKKAEAIKAAGAYNGLRLESTDGSYKQELNVSPATYAKIQEKMKRWVGGGVSVGADGTLNGNEGVAKVCVYGMLTPEERKQVDNFAEKCNKLDMQLKVYKKN